MINCGPGIPCLSPSVYALLVSADIDYSLEHLPMKDDSPVNLATVDLHQFIEKVRMRQSVIVTIAGR